MPSPARLARLLLERRVPLRARLGLVAADGRRRIRPQQCYRVPYGRGELLLSDDDFAVDWASLRFVLDGSYATDYREAIVRTSVRTRGTSGPTCSLTARGR